jgi:hypothetical protein
MDGWCLGSLFGGQGATFSVRPHLSSRNTVKRFEKCQAARVKAGCSTRPAFFSMLAGEGVDYGVRILSGRPRSGHAERELFGFRGCYDQHLFAATVQIAFAFFQDGDDATAILAFVDIGFFAHDGPPCGSVDR